MRIIPVAHHSSPSLFGKQTASGKPDFVSGEQVEDQVWDPPVELDSEHLTAEQIEQIKQMLRRMHIICKG